MKPLYNVGGFGKVGGGVEKMWKKYPLLSIAITIALLMGSVSAMPVQPQVQSDDCRYFNDTGHYVCGSFRQFFESRGGVEIFGYPLTVEFEDPAHDGLKVQYFQRSRIELHPENPEPYKVQLGLLVDELGYQFPPARQEQIPASNSALHHYFPNTQHVVSYAFLDYFRKNGGVDIFGYPRSEFMYESGHLVQYFQRARMEWHPENAPGSQMHLTKLGEMYIERFGMSEAYTERQPPPDRVENSEGTSVVDPKPPVTSLNLSASVRYAITGRQGMQTVFVYVSDQQQQPVAGAAVKMVVHYQSGDQSYDFEATDASGFTSRSFEILSSPPGKRVVIDVRGMYEELNGATQTFFLPWW